MLTFVISGGNETLSIIASDLKELRSAHQILVDWDFQNLCYCKENVWLYQLSWRIYTFSRTFITENTHETKQFPYWDCSAQICLVQDCRHEETVTWNSEFVYFHYCLKKIHHSAYGTFCCCCETFSHCIKTYSPFIETNRNFSS